MTLKEYLYNPNINFNDHLYLNKFKSFFKQLGNHEKIIYYEANHHQTPKDLLKIFSESESNGYDTKLLMINPDIDFPFIKQEFIDMIENENYNQDIQTEWEKQKNDFFLNFELIEKIPKNLKIICHSNLIEHENVLMIPIGRDFKGINYINKNYYKIEKSNLCYLNYSTPPHFWHWYGRIRQHISDFADSNSWILKENTCLNQSRNINNSFINYYEKLMNSKFIISPRGCGLDTYRIWDSIYLGCVPIVVNYSNNTGYNQLKDLPILFLKSWKDYFNLTEKKLNLIWEEMLNTEYNYEKLNFSYWENKILNF